LQFENLVEAIHIKRLLHRLERRGLEVLEDSVDPPGFQEGVRGFICNQEFDNTHLAILPAPPTNETLSVADHTVRCIPKQNQCSNGLSRLKDRLLKPDRQEQAPGNRSPVAFRVLFDRAQGVRIQLG